MSSDWAKPRIEQSLSGQELDDFNAAGNVKYVKADVTGVNPDAPGSGSVEYTELTQVGDKDVTIGNTFDHTRKP